MEQIRLVKNLTFGILSRTFERCSLCNSQEKVLQIKVRIHTIDKAMDDWTINLCQFCINNCWNEIIRDTKEEMMYA